MEAVVPVAGEWELESELASEWESGWDWELAWDLAVEWGWGLELVSDWAVELESLGSDHWRNQYRYTLPYRQGSCWASADRYHKSAGWAE